ncbi:uncharacterized protein RHIMIDRAFT_236683 [Rhizopus microsporus ATCC 52813]|uniref:Uncharacterized protein n=1 Tax=Rhizopus microsporus ATCC 52813 TaxID=1340429 RepID=A0A2G4SXX9_RHIZD|nr:uncharacterized protein RHIMIDRAFT_236683 [Rhizopus microsporus ATCC 52813]PHZ13631.1 hypothetical protein RHIMIDRAFT_236683 [Rhizopus microsporus ATCC 52813]
MQSQFSKIVNTIATDFHRALQYAKNEQAHCASFERKYEDICDQGNVTPMEDPRNIELAQTNRVPENGVYERNWDRDWDIVNTYKKNNPGRMNWMACYEFGQQ